MTICIDSNNSFRDSMQKKNLYINRGLFEMLDQFLIKHFVDPT